MRRLEAGRRICGCSSLFLGLGLEDIRVSLEEAYKRQKTREARTFENRAVSGHEARGFFNDS
jgi:hypothetical protein